MHSLQEQRERISISNLSLARDMNRTSRQNSFLGNGPESKSDIESDQENDENTGVLYLLRTDDIFRGKMVHTFWLGFAFFFLGWSIGIFGPSFPDLRLITGVDLESASWLFTAGATGYLLGSIIGGVAFDRFNKNLLMMFNLMGMAITNGLIPWCRSFWLMTTMMVVCGGFEGSLETGGNADIVATWGSEGSSSMLAIHFAFSAGGIVSPFILEPFLAKETCDQTRTKALNHIDTTMAANLTKFSAGDVFTHLATQVSNDNKTLIHQDTIDDHANNLSTMSSINITDNITCDIVYGETFVQYAWLIAATMTMIASFPFLKFYISDRKSNVNQPKVVQENECKKVSRPERLPPKLKAVSLFLLCSMMFFYTSIEDNFNGFMMTFILSYLKWPKSYGTLANSLNWASFALSRLTAIFIVRHTRTCTILYVYIISLTLSILGFLLASLFYVNIIWLFIPLIGFSLSVIMPSIFTWTEERLLPVSGTISSLYLVTGSLGAMISPILFGYLMEERSILWYVYLLLILSSVCLLLYFIIRLIEIFYVRPLIVQSENGTVGQKELLTIPRV